MVYPEIKDITLGFLPFHNPRMCEILGQVEPLPPQISCMGATLLGFNLDHHGFLTFSPNTVARLGSHLHCAVLSAPDQPILLPDISLTSLDPGLLASSTPSHPSATVKVAVVKGHSRSTLSNTFQGVLWHLECCLRLTHISNAFTSLPWLLSSTCLSPMSTLCPCQSLPALPSLSDSAFFYSCQL